MIEECTSCQKVALKKEETVQVDANMEMAGQWP